MRRFAVAVTTLTMTVACGDTPTAPTNVGGWVPTYNGTPVAFAGRVLDNATGVGAPNAIVQFGLSIASVVNQRSSRDQAENLAASRKACLERKCLPQRESRWKNIRNNRIQRNATVLC
jgi:hypothetical protein